MEEKTLPATGPDFRDAFTQGTPGFPLQYYVDELETYPGGKIALHYHPELEFYLVRGCPVAVQAGRETLVLAEGEGLFVNANVLHGYAPAAAGTSCHPNIVFSQELLAPYGSRICARYLRPILEDEGLPYVRLRPEVPWQAEILDRLDALCALLQRYSPASEHYGPFPQLPFRHAGLESPCYELEAALLLGAVWACLYAHRAELPRAAAGPQSRQLQVRMQRMLSFIQREYAKPITLGDIAGAAGVSKSEAARCFSAILRSTPGRVLEERRLTEAGKLLRQGDRSVEEIAALCGFSSASYFGKRFRRAFGQTPLEYRKGLDSRENL